MQTFTLLDRMVANKYGVRIAGVDEVGVGCIAGPICACALMMPYQHAPMTWLSKMEVRDSKQLTRLQRERLLPHILVNSIWALGWSTIHEINRTKNIVKSSAQARLRALRKLQRRVTLNAVIVDFFTMPSSLPVINVAKADNMSFVVACASIVAKCMRDHYMIKKDKHYQQYDWVNNVGYRTMRHFQGLAIHGPSPWHRTHLLKFNKGVFINQHAITP